MMDDTALHTSREAHEENGFLGTASDAFSNQAADGYAEYTNIQIF